MMQSTIKEAIQASIEAKTLLLQDAKLLQEIETVAQACIEVYRRDGKVLFCGNGGSAADAQHLAAELSGRFYFDRPPLFAEALHVNTSFVTAVGNDYGYDAIYERMVEAAGRPGDLLFAMSTSGNSPNVLRAAEKARTIGMKVVAMTGNSGGELRKQADYLLNAPSDDTPRIQECHMLMGHTICQLVEAALFKRPRTS
ncbi:MAG: D-sedoheptulose 7-phosphate isomerase [Phaeodactylibacter sp.]|uniref:D-sedoheptulose-7-phosphate isomerase n=1 Tax=Phaeodactylibacter sp. TaxID=1940289 RepID=UPI0032EC4BBD